MFDTSEIYEPTRVEPAGEPTKFDRHLIPDDLESILRV
jgi:hypothetical protein